MIKIKLLKASLPKIRLPQISLAFHQKRNAVLSKPAFKQENGFRFRLENGKSILMEKFGTKAFEVKPIVNDSKMLLLQNDKNILLENGVSLKQE